MPLYQKCSSEYIFENIQMLKQIHRLMGQQTICKVQKRDLTLNAFPGHYFYEVIILYTKYTRIYSRRKLYNSRGDGNWPHSMSLKDVSFYNYYHLRNILNPLLINEEDKIKIEEIDYEIEYLITQLTIWLEDWTLILCKGNDSIENRFFITYWDVDSYPSFLDSCIALIDAFRESSGILRAMSKKYLKEGAKKWIAT